MCLLLLLGYVSLYLSHSICFFCFVMLSPSFVPALCLLLCSPVEHFAEGNWFSLFLPFYCIYICSIIHKTCLSSVKNRQNAYLLSISNFLTI